MVTRNINMERWSRLALMGVVAGLLVLASCGGTIPESGGTTDDGATPAANPVVEETDGGTTGGATTGGDGTDGGDDTSGDADAGDTAGDADDGGDAGDSDGTDGSDADDDTTDGGEADGGGEAIGACENTDDTANVAASGGLDSVNGILQTCSQDCQADADPSACTTSCFQTETLLSNTCTDCFTALSSCVQTSCAAECTDAASEVCTTCIDNSACNTTFTECSGLSSEDDTGTDGGDADAGDADGGADAGTDGGTDGGTDAGTDGGADAGADGGADAGDTGDVSYLESGSCVNDPDKAVITDTTYTVVTDTANTAFDTCVAADFENFEGCVTDSLVADPGFSNDCASCFSGRFGCFVTACNETCGADHESAECTACLDASDCDETFSTCSGIVEPSGAPE